MNKFSKVGITLAAVGGTLLMAAPMAFASVPTIASASAAGSHQWQDGSDASGVVMDQNSSVSTGQLQAQTYYNSAANYGGNTSSQNYMVDDEGGPVIATSNTSTNDGGTSYTKANDYSTEGASVIQNQSQVVTGTTADDQAWGGDQGQKGGAITANVGMDFTLSGGIAGSKQYQDGGDASLATMSQSSNVQTGDTTASWLESDTRNYASSSSSQQFTNGSLTTNTSGYNKGSNNYTVATNYSNPIASVSQDQNQVIGYDGSGGYQKQSGGALSGTVAPPLSLMVATAFWSSVSKP